MQSITIMITVRQAIETDLPTINDFQLRMALETENLHLDKTTLALGTKRLLGDPSKGRYYVAEIKGEVIGCLMTTFEWSDWRDGTVLWIQSVYILEKYRGQGVYKALYQHIQQFVSADHTLRGVRLYVDRNNLSAQRVYHKLGMNGEHYLVYEWMKD